MADQTVSLKLDADASGLKSEVQESGAAMEDLAGQSSAAGDQIEASVTGASAAWDDHAGVINGAAVAVVAMGAAVEGLARSQQDTRAVAGRLANALEGETTDSVMGLAAEIHNATTDLDELVVMMETGRRQGITSAEGLQEYALHWDMVGDATGESAEALAASSVALRALGIDAGNEAEALDAFGYITTQTSGSVGEFLQFVERTGPELRDLGLDIDGTAAVLGILEQEFGMTGRVARTEFRSAVNDSDGTLRGMLDTLGISESQFASYRGEVEASSGVIEANAEAFGESRTRMQELTASLEGFLAQHSGVVDSVSALSPALTGAGGAILAVNQFREMTQNTTGVISGLSTGARSFGRFMMGPWGVALAAGAAAFVMFQNMTRDTSGVVQALKSDLDGVAADFSTLSDEFLVQELQSAGVLGAWGDLGIELDVLRQSLMGSEEAAAILEEALTGNISVSESFFDALDNVTGGLVGSQDEHRELWRVLNDLYVGTDEYNRALEVEGELLGDTATAAGGFDDALGDLEGQLDGTAASQDDLTGSLTDYLDEVRAAEDPVFALDRALQGVEAAQDEYNEAVREHGPASEEAQRASMDLMGALSDVEAAAIDGDLSFSEFDARLRGWVDQGHVTAEQADAIRNRVEELTGAAHDYSGEYYAEVIADTAAARDRLADIVRLMGEIPTHKSIQVEASLHGSGAAAVNGQMRAFADGGQYDPSMGAVLVGEKGPEIVAFGERAFIHDAATTAQAMPMLAGQAQGGDGASSGAVYNFYSNPSDEGLHQVRRHEVRRQSAQVAYG